MAPTNARTEEQVRKEIETERERLASAVEVLRSEFGEASNVTAKLKSKLPVVAGTAASAAFVLAGGIGATMRYFARRGRDGPEKARVGRWSLRGRN